MNPLVDEKKGDRGALHPLAREGAAGDQHASAASPPSLAGSSPAARSVSKWERGLAKRLLTLLGNPPLSIVLWDGAEIRSTTSPSVARVCFRDRRTLLRVVADPLFQFPEAYGAGTVEVEGDLVEQLTAVQSALARKPSPGLWGRLATRWLHRPRGTSLGASRENIHHHYDLGNDFYKLWLDEQMAYTCAYFASPTMTLEQAQSAKYEHVCRKLRLRPGETVVEAGCGWGTFALYMASHYGVLVRAYNISHEQVVHAQALARREGLEDRVEFIEDDWRNIRGRFDVFVSVGMLEHVGRRNYRHLGDVIHRCLAPEGRGLLHSIGRNKPELLDPWIERRIFPGAYPPSLCELVGIFEPHDFSVLDVENLRLHYAQTLRHWLDRFERSADRVAGMFDERFVRMWRLYLAGSVVGFRTGSLQLFQALFARGASNDLPRTRAHLYADAQDSS